MNSPLALLPYQAAFAANPARFKIGLWARQTGKDFTCAAEAVIDCLSNANTTWLIVAAGERQALESLEKAKEWASHFAVPIQDYSISSPTALRRNSSAEIKWANGSRIIALPANPQTIRGYSANLILTEFAFHENPDAIWRAIYPSISNPLRGGLKKLRIISTPNGLNNKFAHLWLSPLSPNLTPNPDPTPPTPTPAHASTPFFKSRLTIHDAIAGGLPLNAEELRSGLNDQDAWSQEYLCEFMDDSTVLLPYDLIETCESSLATETSSPQSLSASSFTPRAPLLYAGVDFARKNHLTVCWIIEQIPALGSAGLRPAPSGVPPEASYPMPNAQWIFVTREVLCLRDLSTPDQLAILLPRLKRCRQIAIDYTGPGIGLGDYLAKELNIPQFPHRPSSQRLELCQFTAPFKAELFPRLRAAFEHRELLIPINREIREDLHSIYRTLTNSGQILYRALSTSDGHADRTTALALALRAARTAPPSTFTLAKKEIRPDPRYLPPKRILAIF